MRKQNYYCFFLICLLFIFGACNGSSKKEGLPGQPYSDIEIPTYAAAYKVEKITNKPKGTKSVRYYVKAEYPAADIVRFYKEKFVAMGWVPKDKNKHEKIEWESFKDGTLNGTPQIRQLMLTWTDSHNKDEAFIALRYKKYDNTEWNNELFVICQIQPLIDLTEIDIFLDKLHKSGEYPKFMELLDKYKSKDGDIDFEAAIKENPNNMVLLEYFKLINKVRK